MQSPTQIAQNWQRGLANSTEKIKAGIAAVQEAPTAKAARAVDRMVAGIQRAAAEGKIQAGLQRVTLADWQQAMLQKGVARVAAGAQASVGKFESFMSQFLPHLESGMRQLESMPRGDLEQNIARATAMMRHNSTFRRRS